METCTCTVHMDTVLCLENDDTLVYWTAANDGEFCIASMETLSLCTRRSKSNRLARGWAQTRCKRPD